MNKIICGDALTKLKKLPDESIDSCVTSPPYWGLRDYGVEGQLGLEKTPEEFVASMVAVLSEVRRVLKKEGTLWLNIGDSYATASSPGFQGKNGQRVGRRFTTSNTIPKLGAGIKQKDLVGIPWMLAFALRADGWYLRQDIIWSKPNPMPESITDRCTKSHEYIFLLSKSSKYYYDAEAIKTEAKSTIVARPAGWATGRDHSAVGWATEKNQGRKAAGADKRSALSGKGLHGPSGTTRPDGSEIGNGKANKRSVWSVQTEAFSEAHFATFPEKLIEPMIMAGTPPKGIVLDPFMGAGTTALVAKKLGRNYLGIELNPEYIKMAEKRLQQIPNSLFV